MTGLTFPIRRKGTPSRPLPLAPLLAVAERRIQLWGDRMVERYPHDIFSPHHTPATRHELGALLGVNVKTIDRWREKGEIDVIVADAVAIRMGLHPTEIWPNFADIAPWLPDDEELDDEWMEMQAADWENPTRNTDEGTRP